MVVDFLSSGFSSTGWMSSFTLLGLFKVLVLLVIKLLLAVLEFNYVVFFYADFYWFLWVLRLRASFLIVLCWSNHFWLFKSVFLRGANFGVIFIINGFNFYFVVLFFLFDNSNRRRVVIRRCSTSHFVLIIFFINTNY